MDTKADILFQSSQHSIAKLPYRRFPSVTFQGDTLSIICSKLNMLAEKAPNKGEMKRELDSLNQQFTEILAYYERVILDKGYELPYSK